MLMDPHVVNPPRQGGIQRAGSVLISRPAHWKNGAIPVEILGEIFPRCLPEKVTPLCTEAPMLLCHICTFWREVAFSMPSLWVDLYIFSYSSFRTEDPIPLGKPAPALVKQWFLRAGNSLPLSLGLGRIRDKLSFRELAEEVILPYASRWRSLQLHSPWTSVLFPLFRLPPTEVVQLEILELELEDRFEAEAHGFTAFEISPQLYRVKISCLSPVTHEYLLPWQQLTHLALHEWLSPMMFTTIFSRCVSLQKGIFVIGIGPLSPASDLVLGEGVILPSLVDLDIAMDNRHQPLLERFHFPNLQRFRFHDHDCPSPRLSSYLITDLRWVQLSPHLLAQLHSVRTLSLLNNWRAEDMIRLLQASPQLAVLEVSITPELCDFWQALIWDPDESRHLIPKLQELIIHLEDFEDESFSLEKTIVDITHSRRQCQPNNMSMYAAPIRLISVTVRPENEDFLVVLENSFRKHGDCGVKVQMKSTTSRLWIV